MTHAASMTPEQAHAALFDEILTLEETRAATFLPGALTPSALHDAAAQGEALLRSLAVIDDGAARIDDPDQQADPALLRMEAKLDILTLLVADLAAAHDRSDARQALVWSARGVELTLPNAPAPGQEGMFRVRASDWLPTPLLLPSRVLAVRQETGASRVWLGFEQLSAAMESALERHVFRIHRRAVAHSRRER
ncbi:Atypical PilZ domain-containing protein, cyclic di-GMP receptor [Pseudoxanthomonas sp. GM95]|uniref:PilZ domain-containing protein n=1 Tax=Pseudoxanthomonas sp. GM95 TaxID=1881043 RepID=UPI0008B04A1C|nr:PilZ domain-containing protein [Pseudoxanthomonas sp. GM95]SEK50943.1 Atypical PilZ domain-containing protein, cyclic di-GMP receptor [Pseudoxanthomonas sp. GM95]